jgi:hypothetical protein
MVLGGGGQRAWAGPVATTTTLAVTSGGSAVSTVNSGSVVTLTATVTTGGTPVTVGRVNFCDATATYCTDIHLLGTAQLTKAGKASMKFRPGVGSHSYKVVFAGTPNGTSDDAGSTSSAVALTVTGTIPTSTSIAASGSVGNYSLTATVSGSGSAVSPTGSVSFLDTSSANALLGAATLGAGKAGLSFLHSASPATGSYPSSIAVGDFNGDGIPDLAIVDSETSNKVTILLGNGDGTFTPAAASPATGNYPFSIAAADFNGDGILDLAVVNNNDDTVTILLGNGDGTFTSMPNSPATGSFPNTVAVGDFNRDGLMDLAIANGGSSNVTILLGNGDGTFTPMQNSPAVGGSPHSIAVGDFNGDGIPDLATANTYGSANVTILLGKGDGTFIAAQNSPVTGSFPTAIAAGDFNGDGKLDLAVTSSAYDYVTILLGDGTGNFTVGQNPATGANPLSIAVGDFNGDGIPDLAVANESENTVTILLGNGDGTFTATQDIPNLFLYVPIFIAVGDFDGDGIPDLAVANNGDNQLPVFLSQVTETATATANGITVIGTGSHAVAAKYTGDSLYAASLSSTTSLTAIKVTPVVTVTPSSSSITTTQGLSVTVAVNSGNGNPTPSGTVTLTGGVYTSAPTALVNGSATINVPAGSLATGTETLTANYPGDSNYTSAQGTSPTVAVTKGTPTVMVTPTPISITTTQTLSVTVTVNGGSGAPTATGSVTLTSGSYTSSATALVSGSATINVPAGSLAAGTDTLTANYTGDSNYNPSTGTASVSVQSFSLSGTAVSVVPGATSGNTSTITVTPVGGFTGSVTLTASLASSPNGAVNLPTLSFGSTSPVSITSASAATATLTVFTTAPSTNGCTAFNRTPRGIPWCAGGSTVLACVLLFGIPARRRRWLSLLGMAVLLVALTGGVLACGGGGGGGGGCTPVAYPGTTAGAYAITVTGTSGATTATGTVTLTVQ